MICLYAPHLVFFSHIIKGNNCEFLHSLLVLDSSINCIPETPTSMISSPGGSPTFPGQETSLKLPSVKQMDTPDTTTKAPLTNGMDIKRGVKRYSISGLSFSSEELGSQIYWGS